MGVRGLSLRLHHDHHHILLLGLGFEVFFNPKNCKIMYKQQLFHLQTQSGHIHTSRGHFVVIKVQSSARAAGECCWPDLPPPPFFIGLSLIGRQISPSQSHLPSFTLFARIYCMAKLFLAGGKGGGIPSLFATQGQPLLGTNFPSTRILLRYLCTL